MKDRMMIWALVSLIKLPHLINNNHVRQLFHLFQCMEKLLVKFCVDGSMAIFVNTLEWASLYDRHCTPNKVHKKIEIKIVLFNKNIQFIEKYLFILHLLFLQIQKYLLLILLVLASQQNDLLLHSARNELDFYTFPQSPNQLDLTFRTWTWHTRVEREYEFYPSLLGSKNWSFLCINVTMMW